MAANIDEFARQRELDTYRAVDTLPDAAFDDIVRLASILCDAPIALISLIDRDRQWFKARTGLDLTQSRRDEAFCDHVIRQPDRMMEVADAARDPRFVDNPFVTGDAAIRFYAGMPLITPGGAPIGTVCVLDREPRELTERQKDGLASLARLTMNLLEARHRERDFQRATMLGNHTVAEEAVEAEVALGTGCTIAIFEVQDLASAAERMGDRALGRALVELEQHLEARLRPRSGDSVNHAAGSGEMIVVMHGDATSEALAALRECLPGFQAETGLRVVSAAADSESVGDRLEEIFLRADLALTLAKDALHA